MFEAATNTRTRDAFRTAHRKRSEAFTFGLRWLTGRR